MFINRKLFPFKFSISDKEKDITGKDLLKVAFMLSITLSVFHLLLGSNFVVVLLSIFIIIIGTIPISIVGYLNIGSVFVFLVAFRYVDFPTIAKLLMLQPLDSNLYQPLEAFFAVLVGLIGYLIAFFASNTINVGKPFLRPLLKTKQLLIISIFSALIGGVAWSGKINAINDIAGGVDISQRVTYYEFFTSFFWLAIITATAKVMIDSNCKKSISHWVAILILMQVVFGFIASSRIIIFNGILSYFLTVISFRGKIQWRYIAAISITVFCIIFFITPIMLYVRGVGNKLPAIDRLKSTIQTANSALNNVRMFNELKERINQSQSFLNYYGEPKIILERASLVEHVDAVIKGTDLSRNTGFRSIEIGLERILPRFLNPKKKIGWSIGYWIYDKIGLPSSYGMFATVPLIAEGYSSFGWLGVFIFPIIFSLPIFLIFKKIGWSLMHNIWGIYFVIKFHNSFVEGDSSTYLLALFRFLPQDILLILAISYTTMILEKFPLGKKVNTFF